MRTTGIICIIAGIILTIFTTFSFFSRDKMLDLGRVEVSKEKEHSVSWSPVIGIVVICAGSLMLWRSAKK